MPTIIYERAEVSDIILDDDMYDVEITNYINTRTDHLTLNGKEMISFVDKFLEEEGETDWSIEFSPKQYFIIVEGCDPSCVGTITPKS